jgi:hypothetical protein
MNDQNQKSVEIIPPPTIEIALPPDKLLKDKNGHYTVLSDYHKNRLRQGWRYERKLPRNRVDRFDDACEEFLNRRNGQLGSKKPRKSKKKNLAATTPKSSTDSAAESKTVVGTIVAPTETIQNYLNFLNAQPVNAFTRRKNDFVRTFPKYTKLIGKLSAKPIYFLKASNRLFSRNGWQNMPTNIRKRLLTGVVQSDFKSLHFAIYMHLIKIHAPDHFTEIQSVLKRMDIWEFFESHGVAKKRGKIAILRIINGSAIKRANEEMTSGLTDPEKDLILKNSELKKLIKHTYRGVNALAKLLKGDGIPNAFGQMIQQESSRDFRRRTFYLPKTPNYHTRYRRALNSIYSSFELILVSETIGDLIRDKEFKVLLHLHDGYYWTANQKYIATYTKQMKKRSDEILKRLGIDSELKSDVL